MSELPDRVRRAFADHDSFVREDGPRWRFVGTAFDGEVTVEPVDDGRYRFEVIVSVPTLSAVVADDVAPVVEDGWRETFELRVADAAGVTSGSHAFDPTVDRDGDTICVTYSITDDSERRGVDDAGSLIRFVEGTYVQGVIPGYEYTEPVADILHSARRQGTGGTS